MSETQPTEEELQNMSPEELAELQKKNCVFCRIIKGEVPTHKVYEDSTMIGILDIYPSTKGHVILLPKEHAPIMPLIPPDVFKHLFSKIKYLAKGVKDALPSERSTIFIANGGVAGQQSPHFLVHVVPRNSDDGLTNFDVPKKGISQEDIFPTLKMNLTKMMQSHLQREGKIAIQTPSKDQLAEVLDQNQQLRDMIINNPDQVKAAMETNPQLKVLFNGIDIDKLSVKLKTGHSSELEQVSAEPAPTEGGEASPVDNKEEETKEESKKEEKPKQDKKEDHHSLLDKVTHMFSK
ncbi:HIT domain-containing protein [archaeon]|nr:HIT domain-containing protein [archaeon]